MGRGLHDAARPLGGRRGADGGRRSTGRRGGGSGASCGAWAATATASASASRTVPPTLAGGDDLYALLLDAGDAASAWARLYRRDPPPYLGNADGRRRVAGADRRGGRLPGEGQRRRRTRRSSGSPLGAGDAEAGAAPAAGLLAQLGAAGVGVDLIEGVDSHGKSVPDASSRGDRFGRSRMIVFEFTLADLARTRFAISPMWELVTSLRVLRNPEPAALHLPVGARRDARRRGPRPGARVRADARPRATSRTSSRRRRTGPVPDARGRARPACWPPSPEQVRTELRNLFRAGALPERVAALRRGPGPRRWRSSPRRSRPYWDLTLRAHWPRIRALLDADLTHRAGRLTDGGPSRLFADLHDGVTLGGRPARGRDASTRRRCRCGGQGLLLDPVRVHLAPVRDHVAAVAADADLPRARRRPAVGARLRRRPTRSPPCSGAPARSC